jgi:cellulose synthase/poly-beta-1,6-N-acetylglucosamine synthase-like glycosyltransferase
MEWYRYIAYAAIISQLIFLLHVCNNYRYALGKYKKKRSLYRPRTVLIVPCRGLDSDFQKNISSFFNQDYENYSLWFVVAEESDPAYQQLCRLKEQLGPASKAGDIQVLVAGLAQACSQKIHNLLYGCNKIANDIEVSAFADSDVCVRSDWLSHIVYPLRKSKNGVASGYRWFIPRKNNSATLALSAINAKIAQLLGNSRFNQVWGGSMAVRLDTFRRLGIDKIWQKSLSDDLSLSRAVKKAGMKVAFVPACLAASYEQTTWSQLFEFGRRQFLITRISAPRTWWFGLFGTLYSILGLWGGAAVAVYAAATGAKGLPLFIAVPVIFSIAQLSRAILRQKMIGKLLEKDRPALKAASTADIFFFWVWSLVLLFLIVCSAFGRTITWRGIRYKLLSPTETIVVGR